MLTRIERVEGNYDIASYSQAIRSNTSLANMWPELCPLSSESSLPCFAYKMSERWSGKNLGTGLFSMMCKHYFRLIEVSSLSVVQHFQTSHSHALDVRFIVPLLKKVCVRSLGVSLSQAWSRDSSSWRGHCSPRSSSPRLPGFATMLNRPAELPAVDNVWLFGCWSL